LTSDTNEKLTFTFEEGVAEYVVCGKGKAHDRIYFKLNGLDEEVIFNIYGEDPEVYRSCADLSIDSMDNISIVVGRSNLGFSYFKVGDIVINSREDVLYNYHNKSGFKFRVFIIILIASLILFFLRLKLLLKTQGIKLK
jgi:hypothetical protein